MTDVAEGTAEARLVVSVAESIAREVQARVARMFAEAAQDRSLESPQLEDLFAAGFRALDGLEETVVALVAAELDAAAVFARDPSPGIEFRDVTAASVRPEVADADESPRGLRLTRTRPPHGQWRQD